MLGQVLGVRGTRSCSPGAHSGDKDTNYVDNVNKVLCWQREEAINLSSVKETLQKIPNFS